MHEVTCDGVTVFWEEGPAPLSAALVFRVGARHETFRTIQVAHLVEHLVMASLPKSHLDANASVDVDTTTFEATGREEEVVDFLHRVCRRLGDLAEPSGALDGLAREAGVLEAEDSTPVHPALGWAAGVRFGLSGLGLLGTEGPGAGQVSEAHIREFAATHYVRENAVLVLTGPPPNGLRLPLPTGPVPLEEETRGNGLPTPALLCDATPHPVLSVELPRGDWSGAVLRILAERVLDDVRHGQGIAYEVGVEGARIDATRNLAVVHSDGREEHADAIAASLWTGLTTLAQDGPTEEELAHDRAGFAAYTEDPRATRDWLEGLAYRRLVGEPLETREEARASLARVTREDVAQWARQAVETAVMGVPTTPAQPIEGLPDRSGDSPPSGRRVEGERFTRKVVALAPRDLSVDVGADGISQTAAGFTVSGRWDQVVGLAVAQGMRLVLLESGNTMLLWDKHLRHTDRLFALLDERLAHVAFTSTRDRMLDA